METIKAGPELNDLIAEKVMGWKWVESEPGEWQQGFWMDGDSFADYDTPNYSEEIEAAWQVVEKLAADAVFANIGPDPSVGVGYHCSFYWDEANEIHQVDAEAPTAPLAIVLAALKAVGEGVGA